MKESVLKEKSLRFAIRIVNLYKHLVEVHKEFVLSKQLLRSGTAIGALVREAEYAESKPDFIHKLSISLKEANETAYWLILLKETGFLSHDHYESISGDGIELIKILTASLNTAKKN
jgi:four helix bundle protein